MDVPTVTLCKPPELNLEIDGRKYRLCFPLSAVTEASEALGKPLLALSHWFALQPKDLAALVACGLKRYQPEIPREEIDAAFANLTVEAFDEINYRLCQLNFPKAMERLEQARAKQSEGASPNA